MIDIYEQAIREAYASCPTDVVIFDTIEIIHPNFQDLNGNETSVRLVHNTENIIAGIETTATIMPGEMVEFIACPFSLILPENKENVFPELKISIDNVSREITYHLESAVQSTDMVKLIYRPYLSTDLTKPQLKRPVEFCLRDISVSIDSVTATAYIKDFLNLPFLKEVYTVERFPGLK